MSQARLQPTSARERIQQLDVWRGFGLLGVIIVNFRNVNADMLSSARADALWSAGFDWRIDWLLNTLASNKAHTIFSFMFGLSTAMIIERARRAGVSSNGLIARRMLLLLVFGWIHYLAIFFGDILHVYALAGLLLLLVQRLSNRALAVSGLVLALFSRLVYEEGGYLVHLLGGTLSASSDTGSFSPDAFHALKQSALNPIAFVRVNAAHAIESESRLAYRVCLLFYYLGRAMLGFAFWRSGWAQKLFELPRARLCLLLAAFAAAGLALTAYATAASPGPTESAQHLVFNGLRHANFLIMAAAYLTALAALSTWPPFDPLARVFAAIGRMSLTNYVLQSFGIMLILFGPGLSLGGDIGSMSAVLLALAFFAAQGAFSLFWWRQGRSQGPLEWCWRKLAYRGVASDQNTALRQ